MKKNYQSVANIFASGGRKPNSKREVKIIDTTLRDAHQSLWATRMKTAHIMYMAENFNKAGFDQVDLIAPIQFDVSVRYLKEDPWERVRKAHAAAPDVRFRNLIRSKNLASFDFLADDVLEKWVERHIENGFRVIGAFDGLNDINNIVGTLKKAKALGSSTFGALSFCESPLHTDEHFVSTAKGLIDKADIDAVMLKDPGGLLTPERVRTLIPALKAAIGDRPLELHSHCLTALAPLVYLEASELGCDALHTSIAPLANGSGQPATQSIVRNLKEMGYRINVNDDYIDKISKQIERIAKVENFPLGKPLEYDALHYKHQIPGGMLSNFHEQLNTVGLGHRFNELLEEVARVREELAWPIMITPFAQFVGTQAAMNLITGERYAHVPSEIKKYVLGYYGNLLGPVDDDVFERIIDNGPSSIAVTPPIIGPMLPDLKKRYPKASIDELLLRAMFAGNQVDEMQSSITRNGESKFSNKTLLDLIKQLHDKHPKGRIYISQPNFELNLIPEEK